MNPRVTLSLTLCGAVIVAATDVFLLRARHALHLFGYATSREIAIGHVIWLISAFVGVAYATIAGIWLAPAKGRNLFILAAGCVIAAWAMPSALWELGELALTSVPLILVVGMTLLVRTGQLEQAARWRKGRLRTWMDLHCGRLGHADFRHFVC